MTDSAITFTQRQICAYYAARVPHLKQRGVEWRGPCPIHGGKGDNLAVNAGTGAAYCHSQCGRGWDVIGFEQALTGTDFKTAKAGIFSLVGRTELSYEPVTRMNGNLAGKALSRLAKSAAGQNERQAHEESGHREPPIPAERVRQGLALKGFHVAAEFMHGERHRTVRFEHESTRQSDKDRAEKTFRWEHLVDGQWYSGDGGIPTPLYINHVFRERDQVALAVGFEGEAKADLAGDLGFAAFSFKNLTPEQAAELVACDVVLWPDNDETGISQAFSAAEVIGGAQSRSIRLLTPPAEFPLGADLIDAVNDLKWDRARAEQFLETAVPMDMVARKKAAEDWPKPEPIQSELPPVQTFSEDLLPESFRALVADVAERMQVVIDFVAIVIVLCLAGIVNRRATIQPKANDTGWVLVPNLWGGIIAQPGFMKSPVIQAATRPLNKIQSEWLRENEEAAAEYELSLEECELRKAVWREEFKKSEKSRSAKPERPRDAPAQPTLRRLVVNDPTFEKLHVIMSENPAGILLIRDELTGWLSQLDRAGREGERAFHLQAWNGDTGHIIDRIGRGTIHVPACCESLLGGIQPGRLRSYLADAIKDGPDNDGLIQRFQLLAWPDQPADWNYVDRQPDASAEEQVEKVFRNLVALDPETPPRFRFSPDAQELFIEWLAELEAKIRGDELHPALTSHLSKYRSLMPSLALLFELADRASFVGFDGSSLASSENVVGLEHTRRAAAWCEYLETHAGRIYSCILAPQLRAAVELANKIKQRKVGADGSFSWRDVYLKGWSGLDTSEAVKQATEVLQDAGWVRELPGASGSSGGRPSNRYKVNPRVWE